MDDGAQIAKLNEGNKHMSHRRNLTRMEKLPPTR